MFFDQVAKEALQKAIGAELEIQIIEYSPKKKFYKFDEIIEKRNQIISYKGYNCNSGRQVMWNVLDCSNSTSNQVQNVIKIIRNLKFLKHQNIVQYIDSWTNLQKKEFIFITEMMNGGSMRKHLQKINKPKINVLKRWCSDIFQTITYLSESHPAQKVALRCSNIYINSNTNQIKLGYNCFLDSERAIQNAMNIPWLSPQTVYNQENESSIVYSFGMTLLQMLTREDPYQVARQILWKIKPSGFKRIKISQFRDIIQRCTNIRSSRIQLKQLISLPFWKIQNEDNPFIEIGQKVKEDLANKSTNLQLTKTRYLSHKPSNISQKSVQNQYEAVFNYKTQTNKAFQIKILSSQNQRSQFQDFVLFFISKLSSKDLNHCPKISYAQASNSEQVLQTINIMKSLFVEKYKQYSLSIEHILGQSTIVQSMLVKKIQMQLKELENLQREVELRILEKNSKYKKSLAFGLDIFDIINFNLNIIEVKDIKKGFSTVSDILNLTYSSICPQNKSQKSDDFDFDFTKINSPNKNRFEQNVNFDEKQKFKSSSLVIPIQKIKGKGQFDLQKIDLSNEITIKCKI